MESAPQHRLVVALDGPGSSGKSSVGAAVALRLRYRFSDTGLLYRALTWLALNRGVALDAAPELVALVPEVTLAPDAQGRLDRVRVDGVDVTRHVHSADVDRRVSELSRVPEVRTALVPRQRALVDGGRIIMAGRDIGTVILPTADLKIYLDASAAERARRRSAERGVDPASPAGQAILEELCRRDAMDSGRSVAPLRPADDARIVYTDGNSFDDTVEAVADLIAKAEREAGIKAGAVTTREPR
ncbi:MAG TPA: (d)CMP kinase [Candidatus Saccharimonadales bacterium]|nr:(d)CMP kinase [Candidatus Saccharimonadales bacterium]